MVTMLRMVGRFGFGLVLGATTIGGCTDPADEPNATTSQTEPTTDASSEGTPTTGETDGDTGLTPASCFGGAACGADEFCSAGIEDCDCDSQFQYCELLKTDPGCAPIPDTCAGQQGEMLRECIAVTACTFIDIGDGWVDNVLECGHYEECSGDCDFDPDSCIDTSSSGADSGSSDSGGSDSGSSDGGSSTSEG